VTVPLVRPTVSEEAIAAAAEVLRSGWLGTGPRTAELEASFAAYCGAADAIGTSSGTAALHLALVAVGVGPGDEVVTTALTYVATTHAIRYVGAVPVFADVQRTTGNLDPAAVAASISDRTRAILVVHYAGMPADLDELYEIGARAGVPVIEDCAHAAGSTYRGRKVGGTGQLHAFSLAATKNLTGAGGGLLTVARPEDADRVRRLRNLGIASGSFERAEVPAADAAYDVTEIGFSYGMGDLSAAIASAELPGLDARNALRAERAERYRRRLGHVPGIELLHQPTDRTSNEHLFVILAERRAELLAALAAADVIARVHYRRVDSFGVYERSDLPVTDWFTARALSLPMFAELPLADVDRVCDVIGSGW
jgi:dTDP-4-amino-4,6-dideoxygalactose transaminase